MFIPLKPVCIRPRINGNSLIHIQYCYNNDQKTLLNTRICIPIECWDKENLCITQNLPLSFGDSSRLNQNLKEQLRLAENLIAFALKKEIKDIGPFMKEYYSPDLNIYEFSDLVTKSELAKKEKQKPKINLDFFFQIDDYIQSKIKKVCKDMPRIYRNMKDHLLEFQAFRGEPITFDCLDLTFYENFVDFLSFEYVQKRRKKRIVGLKTNTVGKTIKQLRTFLRNRIRKRIIPPIDMDGWTILEEEVDAIYLTWNEIKLIQKVDLSENPHLENYRNDFVLGCLTGLRFSDFSRLDEHDMRGDMLYKKQEKSDHWVVIPLRTVAVEILKNRFGQNVPVNTNAEFNRHIKTIGNLAGLNSLVKHSYKKGNKDIIEVKPKYSWITSHTCRRSFCTNEFLAGTPVELIMKISGHKSVKDFYKYIRITPEEAGQKIKQLWQQRGQMEVLK
jgi:site-specific recombinase XerD